MQGADQLVQLLLDLLGCLPQCLQEAQIIGQTGAEIRMFVPGPVPELEKKSALHADTAAQPRPSGRWPAATPPAC
jgi:hypothetical protein